MIAATRDVNEKFSPHFEKYTFPVEPGPDFRFTQTRGLATITLVFLWGLLAMAWRAGIAWLVFLAAACSQAGGSGGTRGPGEDCARTADCKDGLRCISKICVEPQVEPDHVFVFEDTLSPDTLPDTVDTVEVHVQDALPDISDGRDAELEAGRPDALDTVDTLDTAPETVPVDVPCLPNCNGPGKPRDCGGDGCGGQCGVCKETQFCDNGHCTCKPQCTDKVCGDNGCGGTCGTCLSGLSCQEGKCKVVCGDTKCGSGEDKCNCPSDCTAGCWGCCAGPLCKGGNIVAECGKNGDTCVACAAGRSCKDGACIAVSWRDYSTNLLWQNPPAKDQYMYLAMAKQYCLSLVLDGYDDWRLPTVSELRSLIRGCTGTQSSGACNITDGGCANWTCRSSTCNGCTAGTGPAKGCFWPTEVEGTCEWYWSATVTEDASGNAWGVLFSNAMVNDAHGGYVRCVK